jgi:hypothetical protein
MGNIFNTDFQDFLSCLNVCEVEYILVGGYSVILHGYPRTTGDLDIWVNKTEENYRRLSRAFTQFGLSLFDMTKENFLSNPQFDVFSFGRQPVGIDILTQVKGLEFSEANKNAFYKNVEGLNVRVIHLNDLRKAKIAANRPKDIDDLDKLGRGD